MDMRAYNLIWFENQIWAKELTESEKNPPMDDMRTCACAKERSWTHTHRVPDVTQRAFVSHPAAVTACAGVM